MVERSKSGVVLLPGLNDAVRPSSSPARRFPRDETLDVPKSVENRGGRASSNTSSTEADFSVISSASTQLDIKAMRDKSRLTHRGGLRGRRKPTRPAKGVTDVGRGARDSIGSLSVTSDFGSRESGISETMDSPTAEEIVASFTPSQATLSTPAAPPWRSSPAHAANEGIAAIMTSSFHGRGVLQDNEDDDADRGSSLKTSTSSHNISPSHFLKRPNKNPVSSPNNPAIGEINSASRGSPFHLIAGRNHDISSPQRRLVAGNDPIDKTASPPTSSSSPLRDATRGNKMEELDQIIVEMENFAKKVGGKGSAPEAGAVSDPPGADDKVEKSQPSPRTAPSSFSTIPTTLSATTVSINPWGSVKLTSVAKSPTKTRYNNKEWESDSGGFLGVEDKENDGGAGRLTSPGARVGEAKNAAARQQQKQQQQKSPAATGSGSLSKGKISSFLGKFGGSGGGGGGVDRDHPETFVTLGLSKLTNVPTTNLATSPTTSTTTTMPTSPTKGLRTSPLNKKPTSVVAEVTDVSRSSSSSSVGVVKPSPTTRDQPPWVIDALNRKKRLSDQLSVKGVVDEESEHTSTTSSSPTKQTMSVSVSAPKPLVSATRPEFSAKSKLSSSLSTSLSSTPISSTSSSSRPLASASFSTPRSLSSLSALNSGVTSISVASGDENVKDHRTDPLDASTSPRTSSSSSYSTPSWLKNLQLRKTTVSTSRLQRSLSGGSSLPAAVTTKALSSPPSPPPEVAASSSPTLTRKNSMPSTHKELIIYDLDTHTSYCNVSRGGTEPRETSRPRRAEKQQSSGDEAESPSKNRIGEESSRLKFFRSTSRDSYNAIGAATRNAKTPKTPTTPLIDEFGSPTTLTSPPAASGVDHPNAGGNAVQPSPITPPTDSVPLWKQELQARKNQLQQQRANQHGRQPQPQQGRQPQPQQQKSPARIKPQVMVAPCFAGNTDNFSIPPSMTSSSSRVSSSSFTSSSLTSSSLTFALNSQNRRSIRGSSEDEERRMNELNRSLRGNAADVEDRSVSNPIRLPSAPAKPSTIPPAKPPRQMSFSPSSESPRSPTSVSDPFSTGNCLSDAGDSCAKPESPRVKTPSGSGFNPATSIGGVDRKTSQVGAVDLRRSGGTPASSSSSSSASNFPRWKLDLMERRRKGTEESAAPLTSKPASTKPELAVAGVPRQNRSSDSGAESAVASTTASNSVGRSGSLRSYVAPRPLTTGPCSAEPEWKVLAQQKQRRIASLLDK